MLHGHGDDIYEQKTKIKANFSSNVANLTQNKDLIAFWTKNLHVFHSYPEVNAGSLLRVLADKYNLDVNQLLITHGATEAIYLIAQIFSQKVSAILQPTFSEYEDACKIHNHKILNICKKKELKTCKSDLIWLCNPNNPTGKVWEYENLLKFIDENKNTVFVIDQTYRYFTNRQTLSYKDAIARRNVILLDSFTKRYAVPGLRLGYIIANQEIISKIIKIKSPWSVNQMAIESGKFLLKNENILPLNLQELLENTKFLKQQINEIENIDAYDSDTHFFLCKLQQITAEKFKKILTEKYGILIRNADNFYSLNEYYIRIASQNKIDNKLLIHAIKTTLR